jgi:hypothetical protein
MGAQDWGEERMHIAYCCKSRASGRFAIPSSSTQGFGLFKDAHGVECSIFEDTKVVEPLKKRLLFEGAPLSKSRRFCTTPRRSSLDAR